MALVPSIYLPLAVKVAPCPLNPPTATDPSNDAISARKTHLHRGRVKTQGKGETSVGLFGGGRRPLKIDERIRRRGAIYCGRNRRFIRVRSRASTNFRIHSPKPWKIMTRPNVPLVNFRRAIKGWNGGAGGSGVGSRSILDTERTADPSTVGVGALCSSINLRRVRDS